MARFSLILFLTTLTMHLVPEVHAQPETTKRAQMRFKQRCEDGNGKACYDYAFVLWGRKTSARAQKEAMFYFTRACELKFMDSCEFLQTHGTKTIRVAGKPAANTDGVGEICFSVPQFSNARFSQNFPEPGKVRGQKITGIKPNSFWERAGLKENDIIYRVNNMPFNNSQEAMSTLSSSGKKFGFEVSREEEVITLWYTCK